MARITGEWLNGPTGSSTVAKYRGERLGLPESGPGAIAGMGRRFGAIVVDWFMAMGIAALFVGNPSVDTRASLANLIIWAAIGVVAVTLFSFTPGQLIFGIQVGRVDGVPRVGPLFATLRTLLLALVVPAFITDADGRGLHDRLSRTVVVRSR